MSKLKTIFIMVLMLGLATLGISCTGGVKPNQTDIPAVESNQVVTEEDQIRQTLSNFVKAYETHNINLLKESLWEKSSFYSQIVENARRDFAQYLTINLEFSEIKITFYPDRKRAIVTLKKRFQAEKEGEVKYIEDAGIIEMIKPEDKWLIVSMHWRAPMRDIPQEEKRRIGL